MSGSVVKNVVAILGKNNLSFRGYLDWVNGLLDTKYTKLEELSTGSAYCQILHSIFPESFNSRKIIKVKEFPATLDETSCKRNLYLFRDTLVELGATIVMKGGSMQKDINDIDIDGMSRPCSYPAHFKFLQWFKIFCDANKKPASKQKCSDSSKDKEKCTPVKEHSLVTSTTKVKRPLTNTDNKRQAKIGVDIKKTSNVKIAKETKTNTDDKHTVTNKEKFTDNTNEGNGQHSSTLTEMEEKQVYFYMASKCHETANSAKAAVIAKVDKTCDKMVKNADEALAIFANQSKDVATSINKTLRIVEESAEHIKNTSLVMRDAANKLAVLTTDLASYVETGSSCKKSLLKHFFH